MRAPLILRVFKNSQLVEVKQFDQQQIVIGHNADVHLDLDADGVSPIHCLIELRDNGYYICDLGSQSGTFKNGQAVLDEILTSGDEIVIGPFKIAFFVGVPKPKAAPNEAPAVAPVVAVAPPSAPVEPKVEVREEPKVQPPKAAPVVEPVQEKPAVIPTVAIPAEAPLAKEVVSPKVVQKPEIRKSHATGSSGKKKSSTGTYAPAGEIQDLRKYLRPGKGPLLEVLVCWNERVLTTYHFRKKGAVKINQDIELPPGFAPKNWNLIDISNGIKVNTTSEMTLEVMQGNEILGQETLLKAGRAQRVGQGISARLEQNEMICISAVGSDLTLYIRFAPQSPVVPMLPPLMLSASELTGVIMSLVIVSVLALYISATTPKDGEEEKQEDVQRVAQVIFNTPPKPTPQPTPPPPEPKPTPTPTPVATPKPTPTPTPKKVVVADQQKDAQKKGTTPTNQAAAKASTAAKAAEVAPKPNSTNRPKKFTSTKQGGAVKQGATAGANAQSANKDVSKIGLFSAFGGGGNRANIDKAYSGAGEVLGMADKATGTSGFNEDRAGDDLGSKFKDTGAGGKGTATQGIAGIGTKGRSSGQAAYGSGDGFGSKTSVAIEPGGAEEEFVGTIDKEAVRRVIRAKLNEVKSCYERVLNTLPKGNRLEGKVVIAWQIVERGAAKNVRVKSSTLSNSTVENCIRDRLASWTFPEPPSGMIAEVAGYPFVLNQSN